MVIRAQGHSEILRAILNRRKTPESSPRHKKSNVPWWVWLFLQESPGETVNCEPQGVWKVLPEQKRGWIFHRRKLNKSETF
jgi:hypothetical protein